MRHHGLSALLIAGSLAFPRPASASAEPVFSVAREAGWLRLGHYEKRALGGLKSEVIEERFFFSPRGATDPQAELEATLQAFRHPEGLRVGRLGQPPACAFPARYTYLAPRFALPPPPPCPDYEEWRAGLGVKDVSLVYSSAYPNNPASMFGHLLLRLSRDDGQALLDYGVNFEASVPASDPTLIYAFKGLLGFYDGEFALAPYYMKVNEYNYSESRDLWEYDLAFTPAERDLLVSHVWELYGGARFAYYFLTRNCGYELLGLLEAAKPEWNLKPGFTFYVLPADALKRVASHAGAIRAERKRLSLHHHLEAQIAALSPEQGRQRAAVLAGELAPSAVGDAPVLDAVVSTYDFRRRKAAGNLSPQDDERFRATLVRRAALGKTHAPEPVADLSGSPVRSHGSAVAFGGALAREGHVLGTLGARIGLHDLLDPREGYAPGLQVDAGLVRLSLGREDARTRLRLEEARLVNLLSLFPVTTGEFQSSWHLRAEAYTPLDLGPGNRLAYRIEGGPGLAKALGAGWLYAMALVNGEWIPGFGKRGRYGPGLEAGAIVNPGPRLAFSAKGRSLWEMNRLAGRDLYWQAEAAAAYSFHTDLQLRAAARAGGPDAAGARTEEGLELRWYF